MNVGGNEKRGVYSARGGGSISLVWGKKGYHGGKKKGERNGLESCTEGKKGGRVLPFAKRKGAPDLLGRGEKNP